MSAVFKGRREDERLITGQGRYTADWNLPGQVYGYFLRADRAHAEIVTLDVGEASRSPGVLAVLTGWDLEQAGFRSPRPISHFKGKDGTLLKSPHRPALAHERVRFGGEPVALVVAEREWAAQDAAERIVVDYRDLTPLVEPEDALASSAPLIHADAPGNLAVDYEYGDRAATEAAFARAAHIVRVRLHAQRIAGNPMEPKACVAACDTGSGRYDIYMPTQGMSDIQTEFAYITGLAREQFRIHARDVGGAFGVRNEIYPEFAALAFAARSVGRPVKWTGTRSESIMSDHHGRGAALSGELALDNDGNFLGLRIGWLVDLGAYCSNAGPFINTAASPTSMAANAYRTPAIYGLNRLVFTTTTPTTAYRGAGRPNASYLMERLVDEAARATGIDRVELRRRNLLPRDAFPYKTPTGSTYDSGDPQGLLAQVLEAADWSGFERRRAEAASRGTLRGIGCAVFIEPSGGVGQEEIAIRFDVAGTVQLYTLSGPSGQGHETVFPEVVSEILGLKPEQITLRYSDPDGPPLSGTGSFGSRSLISHGGALSIGAKEVIRKGLALAAKELEVASGDLVFEHGRYRVPGTDLSIGLDELVRKHAGSGEHPLDAGAKLNTSAAFPSGAHVAEVEIDPETGTIELLSYVAVDDCGRVMNHALVEGQLHGGLMQGIGQIFGEHCVYDPDGQLLTGTFMDYFMPRADHLPAISLYDRSNRSPSNPLGVKGAGEAGTTGAIPSVANAVMDALAPLGIHKLEMPYTPHRVWAAIEAAKAGRVMDH
ncbi:MAG: aerobic carbon-monoxide dehydrogenase large subunit [Alphaproteobacteria bacterium]|nr:aerobic carbon-monoxide dehydrogenase large subunit [Alphaproteobacteria bacterium]